MAEEDYQNFEHIPDWALIHFFICFHASSISSFFHYFDTSEEAKRMKREESFNVILYSPLLVFFSVRVGRDKSRNVLCMARELHDAWMRSSGVNAIFSTENRDFSAVSHRFGMM